VVVPGLEREMNRLITGEGNRRNLGAWEEKQFGV
jgi:hypothetical protein